MENSGFTLARVINYVVALVNNTAHKGTISVYQAGCPNIIPGLSGRPIWLRDPSSSIPDSLLSLVQILEDNFITIKEEFLNLRKFHKNSNFGGDTQNVSGFQHYRSPKSLEEEISSKEVASHATDRGDWNVFYFYLHGLNFDDNISKCPKTAEIIR